MRGYCPSKQKQQSVVGISPAIATLIIAYFFVKGPHFFRENPPLVWPECFCQNEVRNFFKLNKNIEVLGGRVAGDLFRI